MQVTTSDKLKTGAFVLFCILLLLAVIFFIGSRKNMFGGTYVIFSNFKNIAGLKTGNYVRYAGINVGTVDDINIVDDTIVKVGMLLQKKVQPFLKEDAMVSIGSDGLMGDKLLVIAPGSANSPVAKDGSTIKAANPVDIDRIINNLSSISDNALQLTDHLSGIAAKINSGQGSLGRLVNDDKLANKLEGTVTAVNKTASKAQEDLEAAKHSFLLRGYFRKKEKQRVKDSVEQAKNAQDNPPAKNQKPVSNNNPE